MVIVAAEQHEPSPLIHDSVAQRRLLPVGGRNAGGPNAIFGLRGGPWFYRGRQEASRRLGQLSVRKRYIDDRLIDAAAKGIDAVVILGAGYDTRAYRLNELSGIPICEVDLPANIARKEAALRGLDMAAGVLLAVLLVAALVWLLRAGRDAADDPLAAEAEEFLDDAGADAGAHRLPVEIVRAVAGLAGTLAGAQALVAGGVDLAARFGVSQQVIGFTVVALGTSLAGTGDRGAGAAAR